MSRFKSVLLAAVGIVCSGAAYAETTVRQVDINDLVPHCDHMVATVLVGEIACKASGCNPSQDTSGIGRLAQFAQMAEQGEFVDLSNLGKGTTNAFITSLKATGCFDIQERETIKQLKEEAELAGVEFKPKRADFLITGAITSVAVTKKTNALAGGIVPVVGAFSKSKRSANISMDVRLVDTSTSSIKGSQTFDVSSEKSNWSFGAGGYSNGLALGGASSKTTPELDTVVNEAVIKAAGYVAESLAKDSIISRPIETKGAK